MGAKAIKLGSWNKLKVLGSTPDRSTRISFFPSMPVSLSRMIHHPQEEGCINDSIQVVKSKLYYQS